MCWWHNYGKWEIVKEGWVEDNGIHTGRYIIQSKTCEKCGKVKLRQTES